VRRRSALGCNPQLDSRFTGIAVRTGIDCFHPFLADAARVYEVILYVSKGSLAGALGSVINQIAIKVRIVLHCNGYVIEPGGMIAASNAAVLVEHYSGFRWLLGSL